MEIGEDRDLIAPPGGGRVYELVMRWLQDVAYADVEDAGLEAAAVWVVRRTRMRVDRFPRFGESCTVRTFCSGIGRMWAHRRTTVIRAGQQSPEVEALSLWVHLYPQLRRPTPLTEAELDTYGRTGLDRRISARLRHPPAADAERQWSWHFRATECDLADHVNNTAYWQPLEEELLGGPEPDSIDVEIEFRSPAQPGEKRILASGERRWIMAADGESHASIQLLDRG
jgi:acyl-ACP thioesterase